MLAGTVMNDLQTCKISIIEFGHAMRPEARSASREAKSRNDWAASVHEG